MTKVDSQLQDGSANNIRLQGIGPTSKRWRDRLIHRLKEQGISHPGVLSIMSHLPRHLFIDEALSHLAYEDTAIPIGFKQTISQPYIVARMTELLLLRAEKLDRVLEIGTGSGYQTTVLSQFVRTVYSVERIEPLYERTAEKLKRYGIRNVKLDLTDGTWGWPDKAPFDGIVVTAAPDEVPIELLAQLSPDAVLIIPVGGQEQMLNVIKRVGEAEEFEREVIEDVNFVPMLTGTTR